VSQCVCVCVRAPVFVCVYVCVCVQERDCMSACVRVFGIVLVCVSLAPYMCVERGID